MSMGIVKRADHVGCLVAPTNPPQFVRCSNSNIMPLDEIFTSEDPAVREEEVLSYCTKVNPSRGDHGFCRVFFLGGEKGCFVESLSATYLHSTHTATSSTVMDLFSDTACWGLCWSTPMAAPSAKSSPSVGLSCPSTWWPILRIR